MNRPGEVIWDEEIAERQLMNSKAWDLLVEKGYVPGQKTQLDFVFVAGERADAVKLKALLEKETDYKVKVINNDDEYEIAGQTNEMPLSLEGLNVWVSWLVEQGRKCECSFDGWVAPQIVISRETMKAELSF